MTPRRILWLVFGGFLLLSGCAAPHPGHVYIGIENPYFNLKPTLLSDYRRLYGMQPQLVSWAIEWGHPFPTEEVMAFIANQAVTILSWELPASQNLLDPVSALKSGEWDPYLRTWSNAVKAVRYPVMIVISAPTDSWTAAQYENAAEAIVRAFKENAVQNVIWVMQTDLPSGAVDPSEQIQSRERREPLSGDWALLSVNHLSDVLGPDFEHRYQAAGQKPVIIAVEKTDRPVSDAEAQTLRNAFRGPFKQIRAILLRRPEATASAPPEGILNVLDHPFFHADLDRIQDIVAALAQKAR